MNAVNVEVNAKGELRIYLDPEASYEDFDEVCGCAFTSTDDQMLSYVLADCFCNGRFFPVEDALAEKKVVAELVEPDENGRLQPVEGTRVWYYPDYQKRSWVIELLRKREVCFTLST